MARLFAEKGYGLVLVARNAEKLRALADQIDPKGAGRAIVIAADLTDDGAARDVVAALPDPDDVAMLVNNAGFGTYGPFAETDLDTTLNMIRLNITVLTELTGLLLPGMLRRRRGRIVNVASTAAFQPGPLMAVYYATKAYVLHFTEALANELDGSGVTATALCPGPTATGFEARAGLQKTKLFAEGLMGAGDVARIVVRGAERGDRIVIPGLMNKLLAQGHRFVPRRTVTAIVRRMQARTD